MRTITAESWSELKAAYLAGAGLRSLARRSGIPEGTVLAHAHREGWSASKRQALQKAGILAGGRQSQSKAIADAVADDHAERARLHVERMGGLIEALGQHAETLAPGMLFEQVGKLDTFDRMARRNYGLEMPERGTTINVLTSGPLEFMPAEMVA